MSLLLQTWLSKLDELCPAIVRHYDYLITADSIPMDGKFEDYLNPVSMSESEVLCDVNVVDLKLGAFDVMVLHDDC